jgi:hypothetical protein
MTRITVLNPKVSPPIETTASAPRLAQLTGATVGFIDNSKLNADLFINTLRPLLKNKYGIEPRTVVRKHAPKDELSAADLEAFRACDAVVQCFGD